MPHSSLIVRNAAIGEDIQGILRLYDDSTQASYPHFIRNEDSLDYFLHYPGVTGDGLFVAIENEEIVGLAIISITNEPGDLKQATIIEFQARNTSSMRILMQAAVNYCHEKDVDIIAVVLLPSSVTEDIFKDWIRFQTGVMMAKLLSAPQLLQALLDIPEIKSCFAGERMTFHIGEETLEATVTPEVVKVATVVRVPSRSDMRITMAPEVFLDIAFGNTNPYKAYLARKIKIQGLRNIHLILRLLKMARIQDTWHITLGDRM